MAKPAPWQISPAGSSTFRRENPSKYASGARTGRNGSRRPFHSTPKKRSIDRYAVPTAFVDCTRWAATSLYVASDPTVRPTRTSLHSNAPVTPKTNGAAMSQSPSRAFSHAAD